jgi:hypothetical protein
MVQIKRAFNPQSKTTPKGALANAKAGSFHDESQLTRKTVKSKASVQRKFVKTDPQNPATPAPALFSPVMDQFTNNANPRYDPSKAPGAVTKLDGTPQPPKGATSGHQKVIPYSNQMQTGGKTLKRKQFT